MSLAGQRVKAADHQSELGYVEVTANQLGITVDTDLTNLTVTVNVPAGRKIKIHGHIHAGPSATSCRWILWIKEGSTVLAAGRGTSGAVANQVSQDAFRRLAPSAGSHTYKLSLQPVSGTVDMLCDTGGTYGPAFIQVQLVD